MWSFHNGLLQLSPVGDNYFLSCLMKMLGRNLHAYKPNIRLSKKLECRKKRRTYLRIAYRESWLSSTQHCRYLIKLEVFIEGETLCCIISGSLLCQYQGSDHSYLGTDSAPSRPSLSPKAHPRIQKRTYSFIYGWKKEGPR